MRKIMKHVFMAVVLCAAPFSFLQANLLDSCDLYTDFNMGYRRDHLCWSIQGYKGNPNKLSELTFRDLDIFQIGFDFQALTYNNIYVRANIDYGWILSGQVQDSDYAGSNRTKEFSRSLSKCNDDNVFDFTIGLGYLFDICDTGFTIAPLAGYSYNRQNLRFREGQTIINVFFPDEIGPFEGLNSTYQAGWNTGWLGVDLGYPVACNFWLFANYEYHLGTYKARANWNLRDDFAGDFIHKANTYNGNVLNAGVEYLLCDSWTVGLAGCYQFWKTQIGTDVTRVITEDYGIVPLQTKLNPVEWRSYSIAIDVGYVF